MRFSPYVFNRWCLGILVFWFLCASAQSDDLQPVKMHITEKILEYSRLQQDNELLRREYESLKIKYDQYLQRLQVAADERKSRAGRLQDQQDSYPSPHASVEEVEADVMMKRAQTTHLRLTLADLQEQERLWKLKAADAEYQKQTLELELAVRSNHYERLAGASLARIDKLNRAILRNWSEEKELMAQRSLLDDETDILSEQRVIFERENAYLETESVRYQSLEDTTKSSFDVSQQALASEREKLAQAARDKQKEKEDLEQKLQALREQRQSLDGALTRALVQLQEREKLLADIKFLKEDNDRLLSAVSGLQSLAGDVIP